MITNIVLRMGAGQTLVRRRVKSILPIILPEGLTGLSRTPGSPFQVGGRVRHTRKIQIFIWTKLSPETGRAPIFILRATYLRLFSLRLWFLLVTFSILPLTLPYILSRFYHTRA